MLHDKSPKTLCLKKIVVSASVDQAFGKDSAWQFSPGVPCVVAVMSRRGLQASKDWIGPFSLLLRRPTLMPGKPVVVIGRGFSPHGYCVASGDGGWSPPDGVVQGTKMKAALLLMPTLESHTPSSPPYSSG